MPRLLVDISAHGYGHLGQTAPVLNALAGSVADLELTVRSALPRERLGLRIEVPFAHVPAATDFGFAMHNAIDIDQPASAERYRTFHADWHARVAAEAVWQGDKGFDAVLSNVAYLPLAGAAQAGIPAIALCSLNWADLFFDAFGAEPWAAPIHAQMVAAYGAAEVFLRLTPGMPMTAFDNVVTVGPICRLRTADRSGLAARLGIDADQHWLLVAMGGMEFPLDLRRWPVREGLRYLVSAELAVPRSDITPFDHKDVDFTQLLASVDAVLTKPGYGTFVEAACHGRPVLYVPREGWAEEGPLAQWLCANTRVQRVERSRVMVGELAEALRALDHQPAPPVPIPSGLAEAVATVAAILGR